MTSRLILVVSVIVLYSCSWNLDSNTVTNGNREKDAIYYFDLGKKYLDENKNQEAIESFDKAIELNPDIAELYVRRGIAKSELKKVGEAVKDLEIAIKLSGDNLSMVKQKGIIEYKGGLYKEALKDLDLVIAKDSTSGHSYLVRGLIKIELDLKDEACEDFFKAKSYGNNEVNTLIDGNCKKG